MKKSFIGVAIMSLALFGCEKNISFDLKDNNQKLVVEATIENGLAPTVVLTKSVSYFSNIDPLLLTQSFVHGASVFMSNGTVTHKLKEYTVPVGAGIALYYYGIDSSNLSTAFTGQLNQSYSLKVVANGQEYTASTTIPKITKVIDSMWWRQTPFTTDTTKVDVMIRATDPPGYGDYVRYYTKTNRQPFYPGLNSVFDDLFIDGTTYDIQLTPGVDRNVTQFGGEDNFHRGDTVVFKLSNIDKQTYDFWRTMEYSYSSVGNPFSSPTKVLGNISNNALGYFGGYATQYRTLIIPH